MKLKVLVTPIIFVIIIILLIWYIVPTFQEWRATKSRFDNQQDFLSKFNAKNANVANWKSAMNTNASDKAIVNSYVPSEAKEEEIVDNVNSMASDAGVSVNGINLHKIAKDQNDSSKKIMTQTNADETLADEISEDVQLDENKIEVKVTAYGSYPNLRNFLGKLAALRRYNEVTSLDISAGTVTQSDGTQATSADPNFLKADITLVFDYAPKVGSLVRSINDKMFEATSLDMTIGKSIVNLKNTEIRDLSVGQAGRSNPFIK